MQLQIESRNVDMTPRWSREIEERIENLKKTCNDLIHGRVVLTKNLHHKNRDDVAEALVTVTLPGRHTLTARKEEKTFEEAIRAAFASVAIELQRYRDKRAATTVRAGSIPPHRGVVVKILRDAGYGFILEEGGDEVYFHRNALDGGLEFDTIETGIEVVFNREAGERGPQATVVHPLPVIE